MNKFVNASASECVTFSDTLITALTYTLFFNSVELEKVIN